MHSSKDKTVAASMALTEVQSSTPGQRKLRKSVTLLKQQLGHTDRVLQGVPKADAKEQLHRELSRALTRPELSCWEKQLVDFLSGVKARYLNF